jgi:TonB family protein
MRARYAIAAGILITTLATASPLPAQSPTSAPLSPGAAVMLLDGELSIADFARLKTLIEDERPLARATAARIVTVRGIQVLGPALVARLPKEDDPEAAREMVTAVGRLALASFDQLLFRTAERFAPLLDATLVRSIALRGHAGASLLPRIASLRVGPAWQDFFAWTSVGSPEALEAAASAILAAGADDAWRELLAFSRDSPTHVSDLTLARSLGGTPAPVREATYWHLLQSGGGRLPPGSPLAAALAAPETREGVDAVVALAHELVARHLGAKPGPRVERIVSLPADDASRVASRTAALVHLTRDERRALARASGEREQDLETLAESAKRRDEGKPVPGPARSVRTASPPPGLPEDVLAATGCVPDGQTWALLEVAYGDRGQVGPLTMPPTPQLSPECLRDARALLLASLVPPTWPPARDDSEIFLLPMSTSFFACNAEQDPRAPLITHGRGGRDKRSRAPRLMRTVNPEYPQHLGQQRTQGTSIIEVVIAPSGCVRSLRTLNHVHPALEFSALKAVSQWQYTPTLLGGVPVPVIMTVTVTFRLE